MNQNDFCARFAELTGHQPLSWQRRLYEEWATTSDIGEVIDLPTGLGKTMVMAIWLIARENHPDKIPTRLIYVVDRRTVVDQATDLAHQLRCNFGKDKLAISTLRGQLADNREWSADPLRPAIIIGTVDLIGSALLFSGYRSSYKRRPLEAGLLGQDSLLVLDEAHLSKPFEKLITSISALQKPNHKPMRVIRMSATSGEPTGEGTFRLEDSDLKDATVSERFNAKKRLKLVEPVGTKDVRSALAKEAVSLAADTERRGKRIVVFVRRPDDARWIADEIRKHGARGSSPYADAVEVLTGTMRGLERDELVEKPVFKERWLNGHLAPDAPANQKPVFLISTSAGEVGFDLNADHLIGDAAPLDSWIQRMGRVNRRGNGDATVILVREAASTDKTDFGKAFGKACIATSNLLADGMDVSPKALVAFNHDLTPEQIEKASSPKPTTVDLTDILLDAWSMTSIIERMPGRPEVGPWLRGIAEDLPQTTLAWRADLDLPGFAELNLDLIEEWFDTHRVLTHETLSVPTGVAAKWLIDRWDALAEDLKAKLRSKPVIIDRAGLMHVTVARLINRLSRTGKDNVGSIRNATLIVPASFGGIERHVGLLDASAPKQPEDAKDADDSTRRENVDKRRTASDVADERGRLRELIIKSDDGEQIATAVGSGTRPMGGKFHVRYVVELESDDDRTVRLVSHVPRREKLEYGSSQQSLREHVDAVRKAIDGLLGRLDLPHERKATITTAAQLAADFHDHGKNRERWQRTVNGRPTPAGQAWLDATLGKSGGDMRRDPRGYRHEFGSLREFIDASSGRVDGDVFDLAMHLIATHHGRGRPHFAKGGFDPACEDRSEEIHDDSIRRFARLQRKYGWWHLAWLENLLRCADAMASSADGTGDEGKQDPVQ
jgi:CRISPR-associated endonuclease/helicase Cas3